MGLPLFVASVESDLPSKSADKAGGATSPSRSGIRRHARPDSRERRAAIRRQMSIRDRLTNGTLRQSSSLSSRGVDSQFSLLNESYSPDGPQRARPFREVLREMARSDDRNRERFEEQLHSLFTGTPLRERDAINNDLEQASLGWFSVDSIPPSTRTRIAGPPNSRPDGVDSRPRSRQRASPLVQQPILPRMSEGETTSRRRRLRLEPLNLRSMSELEGDEDRRSATLQRIRDVNGLGDRERSLSPEVWDTLLTTLTPDPQPPSAGSSFASTVASQSAGVSSGTSLTTPEAGGVTTTDQACESGCENSDTEDFDPEMAPALIRRRRRLRQEDRERRRVRMRLPDYNLDGPVDLDREGLTPLTGLSSSGLPGASLTPELFGRPYSLSSEVSRMRRLGIAPPAARMETREREESMDSTVGSGNLTLSQLRGSRHGWVGHLSVGTSDDEQGTERRGLNRESSTLSGNLTSQGEEDWAGMLHIVRGLARREDIPDEWWAEAGLSRTLP